jgi:hypothetical protein
MFSEWLAQNTTTGGATLPSRLVTDHRDILPRLRQVLDGTGVDVGYYPPPTEEESAMYMGGYDGY